MSKAGQIVSISPGAGVAGGEFVIEGTDFDTSDPSVFAVWVDDVRAPLVALSPTACNRRRTRDEKIRCG